MPLTVTFDTGALDDVVWPQSAKQPTDPADAARVRAAVESGAIQGFFSETLITLEGIQRKDRIDVLGSARLERDSWSPAPNVITTSLSFRQDRKPLPQKFAERIQAARKLGMRALMVPRLLGDGVCAKDDDGTLFEPLDDLEQFVSKATSLRKEIWWSRRRTCGSDTSRPAIQCARWRFRVVVSRVAARKGYSRTRCGGAGGRRMGGRRQHLGAPWIRH